MENCGTGVEVKSNLDKRQEIIQDIIKGASSNGFGRLREKHAAVIIIQYYYVQCIRYIHARV